MNNAITRPAPGFGTSFPDALSLVRGRKAIMAAILFVFLFLACECSPGQGGNPALPVNLCITNLGQQTYGIYGNGSQGSNYVIQAVGSVAGTNWQALGMATGDLSGVFFFMDSNSSPQRFYRTMLLGTKNQMSSFSPASIPGLAYFWNYNDLPLTPYTNFNALAGWTDEISGVILCPNAAYTIPTNMGAGVYYASDTYSLTNLPLTMTCSNFSFWLVSYSVIVNGGSTYLANLYGNDQLACGFEEKGGGFIGNWPDSSYPGPQMFTLSEINPEFDVVDSQGTLYTNGVLDAGDIPIGQPINNFAFNTLGAGQNFNSQTIYYRYMAFWTNTALTQSNVNNLHNWAWNNSVTNVTNGLIGWWKFDEDSGSVARDSSGNGYNGNLSSSASWTGGVINSAITNTDSSLYGVDVPNTGSVADNLTNFSISFWYKTMTLNPEGSQYTVLGKVGPGGPENGQGWMVFIDSDDKIKFLIQTTDEVQWHQLDPPDFYMSDGNWHFYTYCMDAGQAIWGYVDDIYIPFGEYGYNTGGVFSFSNTSDIRFFGDYNCGDAASGELDDVRIYNRILTPKEVDTLFHWRGQP